MLPDPSKVLDRVIGEIEAALTTVAAPARANRPSPANQSTESGDTRRTESARLMRVNHSGEVAAQALYRGQALFTRNAALRAQLLHAAAEEQDHLAWCEQRVQELGEQTSLLSPLWYAGSFAIGAAAGLAGDRVSLGFLIETEQQVAEHLQSHLDKLPAGDLRSREIVAQMRQDEIAHGQAARLSGGQRPGEAVQSVMRLAARIMTTISYRI